MFAENYVAFSLAYKITVIKNEAALPCTERILTDRMSPQRADKLTERNSKPRSYILGIMLFKYLPLDFIAIKTKHLCFLPTNG